MLDTCLVLANQKLFEMKLVVYATLYTLHLIDLELHLQHREW